MVRRTFLGLHSFVYPVLAVALLVWSTPQSALAAGAYVNGTYVVQDASGSSFNFPAQNHTSGNLLVVMVKWEGGATTVTITDTAGNTYTPLTQRTGSGPWGQMFYAKNITGHASNVVHIAYSGAQDYTRAIVHQYSGMDTSNPFDREATGDAVSGTSLSTGNVVTTQDEELIVAFAGEFSPASSYTPGTNFTERFDLPVDAGAGGTASEDRFVSSAGTYNATMTVTPSGGWQLIMATFKVASRTALTKPANNLGLVGYWSFNEGAGTTVTDYSGRGNQGAFVGSPTWVSGKLGTALSMNGTDQYITVPDSSSLDISSSFSISAWINVSPNSSLDSWRTIVNKDNAENANYSLQLNGDEVSCSFFDVVYRTHETTDVNLKTGTWYHVTCTFDNTGNTVAIYIDGESRTLDSAGETNTPQPNTSSVSIGSSEPWWGPEDFIGIIDEVRIYNRALGPNEVRTLRSASAVRVGASVADLQKGTSLENGLVGHWTFDGADLTDKVYDRSGQGNNGYFYNGATSSAKLIGKLGQALQFDGANQSVQVNSTASLQITGSLTLAAWVRADTFPGGDDNSIIIKAQDPACRYKMNFTFDHNPSREAYIMVSGSGGECGLGASAAARYTSSTLVSGRWYHIAGVYSAAAQTLDIYVDGVLNNGTLTGTVPASLESGSEAVQIGNDRLSGIYPYDGTIDDARIYNRALTAAEIKQLYNLGTAKISQ